MDKDQAGELQAFISVAEACWRPVDPSYSWHVLAWRSELLRRRYPLVMNRDRVFSYNTVVI